MTSTILAILSGVSLAEGIALAIVGVWVPGWFLLGLALALLAASLAFVLE